MTTLIILAIFLITILIKIPYLNVPLDADFGIYGYHALFFLRKEKTPSVDTGETHPPGRWLVYALLLKFFNVSKSLFRISGIVFILITQISVFIISNRFLNPNFAYIITLFYGILISFPTFVWVQSNDEIQQNAFSALAIALLIISPDYGYWIFFLIGISIFFALFFKQSAYVNTFPLVFMGILIYNFYIINLLLAFSGILFGIILTGLFYYRKNMFEIFLDIFALNINSLKVFYRGVFFYGKNKENKQNQNDIYDKNKELIEKENQDFLKRQKIWAKQLKQKFFKQILIFTIFIPFNLLLINEKAFSSFLIINLIWVIFTYFTVWLNKHTMPYHFIPLATPIAILSGSGIFALIKYFHIYSFVLIPILIIIALIISRREISEVIQKEKTQRGFSYINSTPEWLFFTLGEKIGKSLKEVTTSQDNIYSWGSQYELYLWAERPSPTKNLFCPHPSQGYNPNPHQLESAILKELNENSPKYIVVNARTEGFEKFRSFLKENYYSVEGKENEIQIFRWIYADFLPLDEKVANERKIEYSKINSYQNLDNIENNQIDEFLQKIKISKNPFELLKEIIAINPFHQIANKKLIEIYLEKGNVDEIMKSLHYLSMEKSENYFISKTLGDICLLNKKYEQSEKLFLKAMLKDSYDNVLKKQLGLSLFYQQKFVEAKFLFEIFLVESGEDFEVMEKLMELNFIMHRKSEAKYIGSKLLQKNGKNNNLFLKVNMIKNNQITMSDWGNNETNIIWEGSQFVNHSLALVNREHCVRLLESQFNLSIIPYEKDQFEPVNKYKIIKQMEKKKLNDVDIHIRHQWPPKLDAPKSGHWVIIQPWEFGYLPEEWVEIFNSQVDEMWVPSTYVKEVYINSGVDRERVHIVPNGVDTDKFNPFVQPYRLKTKKKFKFLFVGGTIYRKGIDILLKSYIDSFTADDDVCLVIKDFGGKSFYKNQTFKEKISKLMSGKNNPEIEYINEVLDEPDLIGLYKSCNVLVHPYRGEGFGLPILEAMACGIPTIITNGGAALDFCNAHTSLFVKATKTIHEINKIGGRKLVKNAWFWESDRQDLSNKMKYASDNVDVMEKMGSYAASYVKQNWDWNISSLFLQNRVKKLVKRPVLRFQNDIKKIIYDIDIAIEKNQVENLVENYKNDYQKSHLSTKLLGYILCAKHLQNEKILRKYMPDLENMFADNPTVLNLIGIIYFELGENEKSIEFLKKSVNINNDTLEIRRNLAEIFIINAMYEDGINELHEILKQNPMDILSLIRMSELSLEAERSDEAEIYIAKILKIEPDNEVALQLKRMLI